MNVVFLRLLSVNVEGLFELRGGLAYIFWPGVMEGCYYFYGNIISILPIYISFDMHSDTTFISACTCSCTCIIVVGVIVVGQILSKISQPPNLQITIIPLSPNLQNISQPILTKILMHMHQILRIFLLDKHIFNLLEFLLLR